MTLEDDARYQANIDRLRELLERHGGRRRPQPKPKS
jgi:D-serine deaminase-like pyridoxal phosphate-dependent protein